MNTGRVIRIIHIPEPKPKPSTKPQEQPMEKPIRVDNWPVKKPEKVPAG